MWLTNFVIYEVGEFVNFFTEERRLLVIVLIFYVKINYRIYE